MSKSTTQSARGGRNNQAISLLNRLHSPTARHALTPRESSLNTLNQSFDSCQQLVSLVAQTGLMLTADNIQAIGKDDKELVRGSNALLKDLRKFDSELKQIKAETQQLATAGDDVEFLSGAVEVGNKISAWEEQFRTTVLPLNGQVHDRIQELVEASETKGEEQ